MRLHQALMNSLYLGASFAPRIEHAASHIQDSSDLSLFPLVAITFREFYANWWPDAKEEFGGI